MSPAVISEMQPDLHREQLEAVGTALDALLLTVYRLTHRHHELFQHMDDVYKEYSEVIDILPPKDRPHALDIQSKLLAQTEEYRQGLVHSKPPVEEQLLNSMDVINTLVAHQNVDEITFSAIKNGVKGCKSLLRSSDALSQISSNSCIGQAPAPAITLEKDFTTNGTQGQLHCPFSKPNNMKTETGSEAPSGQNSAKIHIESTCGHDNLDPVKAELDELRSNRAPSAPSSKGACPVSRCPIRFLNQHSPEEIADYVERHKHEIPRSHAICVKRYQRNPQDMRQLDAKYGGLTSMIAGLGVKHQAFLPDRQTGEGHSSASASTQRVEKWAENVDPVTSDADLEDGKGDDNDEDRQGRFDRPLREVRVGESPSRPWGISVPVTSLPPISEPPSGATSIPTSPEPQTDKPPTKPAGRCPFGHDRPKPDAPEPEPELEKPSSAEQTPVEKAARAEKPGCPFGHDRPKAEATEPAPLWTGMPKDQTAIGGDIPHITPNPAVAASEDPTKPSLHSALSNASHVTFSGPVFFGYSAEETAKLLQQLGMSK
ncbi:uncharacterized protein N7515_009118 [Penicillium bovifimosum]|uniref:Uncharacterized protein n=1 Tax=Penicillium bovifimosum TaxID=126998 RepID=A0A9W9GIN7_9EURO|nr:uncharacterized protein N7515_009118 [Penicillium bovifimosum]KAJ5121157.1 hypothetical protein N7515_009118 [Penicillium bovifimosum]